MNMTINKNKERSKKLKQRKAAAKRVAKNSNEINKEFQKLSRIKASS